MYNVIILGVGALGKRHLSSILNSKLNMDVYCYDINEYALDGFEWENKYNNKTLTMVTSFEQLPNDIDFAIFAMTSKGRREMFDQLVDQCEVKNILFEKVLFQKIKDYDHVGKRLQELGIKAWVNCTRRQMDSYQNLRKKLQRAKKMRISISGGEWGLACNAIHLIDMIEFLSGSKDTSIDNTNLLPVIVDSTRPGFKEVYGVIEGHSGRCVQFSINCMKDAHILTMITISTDIGHYVIFEGKQKLVYMEKDNNYELSQTDFLMPYQSQMTQFVMEDILLNGESRLTTYEVSSRLHLEFIRPLIKFFENNGLEKELCPIT